MTFKVNERVKKSRGYDFDGVIVSAFKTTNGSERYVVEQNDSGLLHIFNPDMLVRDTSTMTAGLSKRVTVAKDVAVKHLISLGKLKFDKKEKPLIFHIDKDGESIPCKVIGTEDGLLALASISETGEELESLADLIDITTLDYNTVYTILDYIENA